MQRKWVVFWVILVLLVAVSVIYTLRQQKGEPDFVTYTNERGENWSLPAKGGTSFTVASAETYPKFVYGTIDPLKVSIGDTQFMRVAVRSDVPMKRVLAEIENDKETDIVELTLVATTTVSEAALQNQLFFVDDNNKLIANDGRSESVVSRLVEKVRAQSINLVDYVYEGNWVVHDTRTITYRTTFKAEDIGGRQVKLVMAWSDPCNLTGNTVNANCTLSTGGEVEGVDNASLSFGGPYNITVQSGATFAWNPGQSITINNGSFSIGVGGQLKQANIYYTDSDGDGYAPSANKNISGGVRVYQVAADPNTTPDCSDNSNKAYPGQPNSWPLAGINNDDFNCDGFGQHQWAKDNASYNSSGYPWNVVLNSQICGQTVSSAYTVYDPFAYGCGTLLDYPASFYSASAYQCATYDFRFIGPARLVCY